PAPRRGPVPETRVEPEAPARKGPDVSDRDRLRVSVRRGADAAGRGSGAVLVSSLRADSLRLLWYLGLSDPRDRAGRAFGLLSLSPEARVSAAHLSAAAARRARAGRRDPVD